MNLDVLFHVNSQVTKVRDKTLKNYPIKKFHLNSVMNVVINLIKNLWKCFN